MSKVSAEFPIHVLNHPRHTCRLAALHTAAILIADEFILDKIYQQIVNTARDLVEARYAALGVPGITGEFDNFFFSGLSAKKAKRMAHTPRGEGLLGILAEGRNSIRIPSIEDDVRSVGFPDGHPQMGSFLGVPIIAGPEVLGSLFLANKVDEAPFSAEDQELIEMLSAHATIAIRKANVYTQVERLAVTSERKRIGMDLHDGTIQSIYAVGLTLEAARLALPEKSPEATRLLEGAIEELNNTIRDIRNYILDLQPRQYRGDLSQGLHQLVREFQANTMVPITINVPQRLEDIPTHLARAIFLSAQEALANVARHSKAKQCTLTLERSAESILLTITDDGVGFDVGKLSRHIGHGLANMQSRTDQLSGSFTIFSTPDQGTSLTLSIPLKQ